MATPLRTPSLDTLASPTPLSPQSQYPFPSVDVAGRYAGGLPPQLRRVSTTSSVTTTIAPGDRPLAGIGQNAISTLLQPPIVRTGLQAHSAPSSGYRAPSARDIPPVTLTNINHVEPQVFQSYLQQVGSLYAAFQRAKTEGEGDTALFHREKSPSHGSEWEAILAKRLPRPGLSRTVSAASGIESPLDSPQRRRPIARRQQTVTPLSTIPNIYSEDDFHLENPRTFDIVSEKSEIVRDPNAAPSGKKTLATNAILQEKLSWYMDTVEVHLISSISTASKSFFTALGSLRELHAEAADSVERIQKLRKELAKLDKDLVIDGLKVVKLKQRRENVRQLADAILQLQDIVTTVRRSEEQTDSGQIEEALDSLDDAEALIRGKNIYTHTIYDAQYQRRDMRKLAALDGALDDLNMLRTRVGRGFEKRFHGSLIGDIRQHVESTETSTTLQRWGNNYMRAKTGQRRGPSISPAYMAFGPELRLELEAELKGLSRARHSSPAATSFKSLALRELKSMIRRQLPSSNDDDAMSMVSTSTHGGRQLTQQEKSSLLARNLRAMDGGDWYKMLATIYTNVTESLRRISVQVKILMDITSHIPDPTSFKTPAATPDLSNGDKQLGLPAFPGRQRSNSIAHLEMEQALDLSSLLEEGVDLIQGQITKIVRVRFQQNAEMQLTEFLQFFMLNRLFTDECEAISARGGTTLKTVIDGQIKEFFNRFGESQKQHIVGIMDADKWDARDFGLEEKEILDRVIQGSTRDAMKWMESTLIWQTEDGNDTEAKPPALRSETSGNTKDRTRSAVVDEQKYLLSESPLAMLRCIEVFEHLATGIPGMGQDAAMLLVECLKLFNSRTSQLILGAGATRSAGLKNITTKHLALSSQSLGFIVALVPYIREYFRRHVPASAASNIMGEFDKVKRLLQEHQNGIHEKLVDIMSGRAAMHVRTMKGIDWDEAAKNSSVPVSPYMEVLTKETTTLHKVLTKHLPEPVVMSIMIPVFASYKDQWVKAFREVSIRSVAAKERLIADAEYFKSRVSKLEGCGDLGAQVLRTAENRAIYYDGQAQALAHAQAQNQTPPTSAGSNPVPNPAPAPAPAQTPTIVSSVEQSAKPSQTPEAPAAATGPLSPKPADTPLSPIRPLQLAAQEALRRSVDAANKSAATDNKASSEEPANKS